MLKMVFGGIGCVCCLMSAGIILFVPRSANFLDAIAWVLLGFYTLAALFIGSRR